MWPSRDMQSCLHSHSIVSHSTSRHRYRHRQYALALILYTLGHMGHNDRIQFSNFIIRSQISRDKVFFHHNSIFTNPNGHR